MTEACIVGWAHSPFGKLDDPDIESLIGRVAGAAIAGDVAASSAGGVASEGKRTQQGSLAMIIVH